MTGWTLIRDRDGRVRLAAAAVALVVIGAALVAARSLLAPIALAAFVALLLSGAVDALARRGLARPLAAAAPVLVLVVAAATLVTALWQPALRWVDQAPATLRALERHSAPVRQFARRVDAAARHVPGLEAPPVSARAVAVTTRPPLSTTLLAAVPTVALGMLSVVVLTFLMLLEGPRLLAPDRVGVGRTRRARLAIVDGVRRELTRYFGLIALINVGLALATTLAMAALGLPNPLLWGAIAGLLNFVPYLGPAVTLVLLGAAALVSFESLGPVIAVLATFGALTAIEGQLVQPWLVGRQQRISPLAVFLAVWVGGWLWGLIGVLLAAPTLVVVQAARRHLVGVRDGAAASAPAATAPAAATS